MRQISLFGNKIEIGKTYILDGKPMICKKVRDSGCHTFLLTDKDGKVLPESRNEYGVKSFWAERIIFKRLNELTEI